MTKDQPWVRENMKAFKGSPEEKALLERYARPLDQPEDRLNRLQKEISDLNERENQAEGEREQIVQTIVMDESL